MLIAYKITGRAMTVYVTGLVSHMRVVPATAVIPSIRKEEKRVLALAAQIQQKLAQFTAGKITVHPLEAEFDDEGLLLCQRLEFNPSDYAGFGVWAKAQHWETQVLFGQASQSRRGYYGSKNTRWHRMPWPQQRRSWL